MSGTPIPMPQLGQAMEFGTIVEWLVEDGAEVAADQAIATVETDKAAHEIAAPVAGKVRRIAEVGSEVAVGDPIATIGDATTHGPAATPTAPASAAPAAPSHAPSPPRRREILASPKAKRTAARLQVELAAVEGSGRNGLIHAEDVERHAETRKAESGWSPGRRTAAERLSRSWQQAPHFVQMIEADASRLASAQRAIAGGALDCSLNDLLLRAAADTLAAFPDLNATMGPDGPVRHDDVAVGLAVATDDGIRVPVVRGAAGLALSEISRRTRELVDRARSGGLSAGDQGGAGLTISNLGRFGIGFGTPVLNLGEPVLLFVGAIEERPVVEAGRVVPRHRTTLSICFDHRLVDGMRAAQFSQALARAIEEIAWPGCDTGPASVADAGVGSETFDAVRAHLCGSLIEAIGNAAGKLGVAIDAVSLPIAAGPEEIAISVETKASDAEVERMALEALRQWPLAPALRPELLAAIRIARKS